jgi:hypothetical protein
VKVQGKIEGGMFSNTSYLHSIYTKFEGKRVTITVKKHQTSRTLAQNRLLWMVYNTCAMITGHTAPEVHESMGWEYLRYQDEHGMTCIRSTTDLNTTEMSEYIERICVFFNVPIPTEE